MTSHQNTQHYTVAKYWKCALQVNPSTYSSQYRAQGHGFDPDSYAEELGKICLQENINIIGLADHGNVSEVDLIREKLNKIGVVVFPGFEIATTEKIHWVCLFPEETTLDALNRYLGTLKLTDPSDGIRPTELGSIQLLEAVEKLNGFCFAAHITDKNGLIKARLNHIWQHPLLKAVQIPNTPDDTNLDESFKRIFSNKDPNYKRTKLPAFLNAKDVDKPDTLKNSQTCSWIKMTQPCFESFLTAFKDPESRIRLGKELKETHYSKIEEISFSGGFLGGIKIKLSEHLNTVIGGRGTGKSTLIEFIRYAINKPPSTKDALNQHNDIIKENLSNGGKIEIKIQSQVMHGGKYRITRKFNEPPIVIDDENNVSQLKPNDLLPNIEIYGQNEIYELARNPNSQTDIIYRFLPNDLRDDGKLIDLKKRLKTNREAQTKVFGEIDELEGHVNKLPQLLEQRKKFIEHGIEEKLKILPGLERERLIIRSADQFIEDFVRNAKNFEQNLPNTDFINDEAISPLPHYDQILILKNKIEAFNKKALEKIKDILDEISLVSQEIKPIQDQLLDKISDSEESLNTIISSLPELAGKEGHAIGKEYKEILRKIEDIRPNEEKLKLLKVRFKALEQERRNLLKEFSDLRGERTEQLREVVKGVNKKLNNNVNLSILCGASRHQLKQFFLEISGIGDKKLSWVDEIGDKLTIPTLVEAIRNGDNAIRSLNWGIQPSVISEMSKLQKDKILELEEIDLKDHILIKLNVAYQGVLFKPLDKLSIGQQCTAILNLLLLENNDPLIMDQPEDNLDNAFIAERIVKQLRDAKTERQFVFATHNANIPVFGDAEWIGIFSSTESKAEMPYESQGSIDIPAIREKVADILEGGREAFAQRKEKYGF